jgi:hypothetical protein
MKTPIPEFREKVKGLACFMASEQSFQKKNR